MTERSPKTHRDLLPGSICPSFMMKQILTDSLDQGLFDDREFPGDGYYWCLCTGTPVGPDDELVRPEGCVPGRRCYDAPRT